MGRQDRRWVGAINRPCGRRRWRITSIRQQLITGAAWLLCIMLWGSIARAEVLPAPQWQPLETPLAAGALSVTSLAGQTFTLSELAEGKSVLLNFWATWCVPCVAELPALQRRQQRDDGIKVLAISHDNNRAKVAQFLLDNNLTDLNVYFDPGMRSAKALGLRGLPTSYLLNTTTQATHRFEGAAAWDK